MKRHTGRPRKCYFAFLSCLAFNALNSCSPLDVILPVPVTILLLSLVGSPTTKPLSRRIFQSPKNTLVQPNRRILAGSSPHRFQVCFYVYRALLVSRVDVVRGSFC